MAGIVACLGFVKTVAGEWGGWDEWKDFDEGEAWSEVEKCGIIVTGYAGLEQLWIKGDDGTMLCHYTARYTKLEKGYMGQLVEWPEVVTEGDTLEDCRVQLQDALHEMILACQDTGMEVPGGGALFEPITAEV